MTIPLPTHPLSPFRYNGPVAISGKCRQKLVGHLSLQSSRIPALASALAFTALGIYGLSSLRPGSIASVLDLEVPFSVQVAAYAQVVLLIAGGAAFVWLAVMIWRGKLPAGDTPPDDHLRSWRLPVNSLLAVMLYACAGSACFALYGYVNYVWTDGGGIVQWFISIGWGSIWTFFVYDAIRFSLFSFVAVWPITFLNPQRPVLYSGATVVALVIVFSYWPHLTSWAEPPYAVWVPWLALIQVLSIPAMYLLHIKLRPKLAARVQASAYRGATYQ